MQNGIGIWMILREVKLLSNRARLLKKAMPESGHLIEQQPYREMDIHKNISGIVKELFKEESTYPFRANF